jgi:Holliday junction resolvase RusA-like endonuclease
MIEFTIPGLPPSVNHCYFNRSQGGKAYNKPAEAYFQEMMMATNGIHAMSEKVRVEYALFFPDRRVRDPGNFEKALSDGLQRVGIVVNDKQIRDIRIYDAGIDRENPRVEVTIMLLEVK